MNKRLKNFSWLGLIALTITLILTFRSPAIAQSPKHYTDLTFPPLAEVKIPKYERYELKNGIVVYLMENHKLPLVSGTAMIRTGSRLESDDQVGLARLVGTVMRTGGTQKHPAEELNEILEQKAAVVETSISVTSGNANFSALSEDLGTVFNLFAEVLRYPAFEPKQFALAKTQLRGEIARRNDEPGDIVSREFRKLIYGNNSPYARTIEYRTLENISRQDLVDFHQKYFRPDGIILGIVGDFDAAKMKSLIEKEFGNWQASTPKLPQTIPPASQKNLDGLFLVDQSQLTQSNILIGHLGGELNSPDYPALSVLNGVLNGFSGRLFNDIRSRQGLAYSVYGYWNPAYDYPGLFIAGGQTRSETTVPFVQSLLVEIEQIRTTPITEQELKDAKESILNSFVFNFEKPGQTLSRLMTYEYFGYPKDFIFQYQQGVKATTAQDIQRVAQEHINPKKIVTLVVGSSQGIQPPLKTLNATVQTVDIAIPQAKKS